MLSFGVSAQHMTIGGHRTASNRAHTVRRYHIHIQAEHSADDQPVLSRLTCKHLSKSSGTEYQTCQPRTTRPVIGLGLNLHPGRSHQLKQQVGTQWSHSQAGGHLRLKEAGLTEQHPWRKAPHSVLQMPPVPSPKRLSNVGYDSSSGVGVHNSSSRAAIPADSGVMESELSPCLEVDGNEWPEVLKSRVVRWGGWCAAHPGGGMGH